MLHFIITLTKFPLCNSHFTNSSSRARINPFPGLSRRISNKQDISIIAVRVMYVLPLYNCQQVWYRWYSYVLYDPQTDCLAHVAEYKCVVYIAGRKDNSRVGAVCKDITVLREWSGRCCGDKVEAEVVLWTLEVFVYY